MKAGEKPDKWVLIFWILAIFFFLGTVIGMVNSIIWLFNLIF